MNQVEQEGKEVEIWIPTDATLISNHEIEPGQKLKIVVKPRNKEIRYTDIGWFYNGEPNGTVVMIEKNIGGGENRDLVYELTFLNLSFENTASFTLVAATEKYAGNVIIKPVALQEI